jgi:hypothetical protein
MYNDELLLRDNCPPSIIVVYLVQGLWLEGRERVAFIGYLLIQWHLYIPVVGLKGLLALRRHMHGGMPCRQV